VSAFEDKERRKPQARGEEGACDQEVEGTDDASNKRLCQARTKNQERRRTILSTMQERKGLNTKEIPGPGEFRMAREKSTFLHKRKGGR